MGKKHYDVICLLLPTCPLRTVDDIKNCLQLLDDKNVDGVVSVTDYEFPITLSLKKDGEGWITENNPQHPFANSNTRSQDHEPFYRPNGAIYMMKTNYFGQYQNFFKGRVKGYYMVRERSVDIDDEIDLKYAEVLLRRS
jgi:CMP-N-acetylneuraminic acid synthetase